ncbi:MAG: hypothetical protein F4X14_09375 [Caldilineaceae bacterium SB0661_bin_32]|uniref:Uncharacterized protein n=1 Tax=Caldilineaceae bacterium SB0661_bin_32 TaxID=2605255 RepID=A0A6B1D5I7_9CHLR|nr:hypothetical protein [Caldilineaceae bacterium SB0661_bin_32]
MRDVWIALIAVGVGSVLTVFAQEVARWLAKRRRRRALALLVCSTLDRFVADCQAAINDEGEYPRGTRRPSVPMPTGPEFPAEIDWTSIDAAMAYRILSLRAATVTVDHELSYLEEELHDPPENDPWFSHRRKRCHKLLSEASQLSSALREMAGLPPASDNPFDNIWG